MMDNAMDESLAELANLSRCQPQALAQQQVVAAVLALGSNYHAKEYLSKAQRLLADLGELHFSPAIQNPDFTATAEQPKPDYINQCAYLSLRQPLSGQQLSERLRALETACDRQREINPPTLTKNCHQPEIKSQQDAMTAGTDSLKAVSMDIDILLLQLAQVDTSNEQQRSPTSQPKIINDSNNSISRVPVSRLRATWPRGWVVMANRYPFKEHEWHGLAALLRYRDKTR